MLDNMKTSARFGAEDITASGDPMATSKECGKHEKAAGNSWGF